MIFNLFFVFAYYLGILAIGLRRLHRCVELQGNPATTKGIIDYAGKIGGVIVEVSKTLVGMLQQYYFRVRKLKLQNL